MIIRSAEFITSAVKPDQYPPESLPEIAFAGRSNAGKSSLINALVNRKNLAKTSSTPGKTRLINFFTINNAVYFVDLPGYGYAKVSQSEKRYWKPMVESYLSSRKTLRGVVIISDIRRVPGAEEIELMGWLANLHIPAIIISSKADKLSKNEQFRQRKAVSRALSTEPEELILFSAKTRQGMDKVWEKIEAVLL
ncbi:MAG: YihA family ribosome biogenesis GTP-binding protein [Desulfobacteraceae bacterium IS3]|nr:MAG: YihA family ribosome biogenesis GTP-binding protein [Desulfobacteraceae bacterium IS3]